MTMASPACSARIPASLAPSASTSLGHLSAASTPACLAQRPGHGHPGEQRQPAPVRGRHRRRAQQHGEDQRRAGAGDPLAALAAAAAGLVLGDQHRSLGGARPSRGEQVVVGGPGLRQHVQPRPQAARGQHGPPQLILAQFTREQVTWAQVIGARAIRVQCALHRRTQLNW